MFWRVDGIAPNRVFTAEWISMEQFTHAGPDLNFQCKLYEADDRIEYIYGTMVGFNGSVDKAYDYTMGVFGGISGTAQTTTTPTAGQYISQLYQNTTNFQNATFTSALTIPPACNSKYTFTPNASFTNGTTSAPSITNTTCAAATSIGLTYGAAIDNCNVYRSALVSGTPTAPAICSSALAGSGDDAAWFSFYNDSPRDIVVLVNASGGFAPSIQLASSCSVALACTSTTTQGNVLQLSYAALPTGTYYVRVNHNGTGVTGSPGSGGTGSGMFTLSVYTTASAPANDVCSGAVLITPNAPEFTGSTMNASSQTDTPNGVGVGTDPDDDDIWYKFVATTTTATLNVRGISPFIPVVELWSTGCPTAATATTLRLYQFNPGVATQQNNALTGLTVGATYYIRIYHRATGAPASGSRQFVMSLTLTAPDCPLVSTVAAAGGSIATPANGAVDVAYGSTTKFAWNAVTTEGVVTYKYYFGSNATPTDADYVTTSGVTITTPTLLSGATYYFQVRTVSSTNGTSSNCATRSFTTAVAPGVPVCAVISSPVAGSSVTSTPTITWGAVTNTYKYTLQVATNASFTNIAYSNTNIASTVTSFTLPTALAGNTAYFVRVTPRNSANVSPTVTCNSVSFQTEVANNEKTGAIQLTYGSTCNATSATSLGATASLPANGIGVTNANADDVWFKFIPTGSGLVPVTITVTGGTTTGTLQNPVIEMISTNNAISNIFDASTSATEVGTVYVNAGSTSYFRVYSRSATSTTAGTFNVCIVSPTTVSGSQTLSGTSYGTVVVPTGTTLTVANNTSFGDLTVQTGGTLVVQGNSVLSGNTFTLQAGGTLQIGSTAGITASGSNGNIQFATRSFSNDANYVYNGTLAQSSGSGLPSKVRSLKLRNSLGLTLTSATSISDSLAITAGTLACGANNLAFLSTNSLTARLAPMPASGAAITGSNFTVERSSGVYNTSANTASGAYYFLGTSVAGATLNNWSVNGLYAQSFQGAVKPSVFTFNESSNSWSAGTATYSMAPGTGAQIWSDISLQRSNTPFAVSGTGITYGNVDLNLSYTSGGSNLVANPYPSSIDFAAVRNSSSNISNSFVVWSQLYKSYQIVTGGVSNFPSTRTGVLSNTLASGQGFFVSATQAGATLNFREAHKVTTNNRAVSRLATETAIRFNLSGNGVTSFASVFFRENASRNFDSNEDARILSGSAIVSTYSADSQRLTNNAMPIPTATDSLGINITATNAGTYTLTFEELSNLPAGMRVFLKDRNNGSLAEITAGFAFNVTLSANTNTNRYVLIYTAGSVTGVASNLGKELVSVFPNPSTGSSFTVRTSGFEIEKANIIITDAVGKNVFTKEIEVGALPVSNTIDANLPSGVYNVTCVSGNARITTKLVVNR